MLQFKKSLRSKWGLSLRLDTLLVKKECVLRWFGTHRRN